MKYKNESCGQERTMTWDDTFGFHCYRGIDCFNSCCRDVTIFLNPLDASRMRKALGIHSSDFLEKYTHRLISQINGMPAVSLRMQEDQDKRCPFVTDQGCSIYNSRPYPCRLYPLDTDQGVEYRFIVDSGFCHGLLEQDQWTVEEWRKDQGLYDYDDLDHDLKDVMNPDQLWEEKIADPRMQDMVLMSLYDPDRFREFIFESTFLRKFKVDEDIQQRIREEDLALLFFASEWLRFILFGKKGHFSVDSDYFRQKQKELMSNKRQ